jgi:hypothetical protein
MEPHLRAFGQPQTAPIEVVLRLGEVGEGGRGGQNVGGARHRVPFDRGAQSACLGYFIDPFVYRPSVGRDP